MISRRQTKVRQFILSILCDVRFLFQLNFTILGGYEWRTTKVLLFIYIALFW